MDERALEAAARAAYDYNNPHMVGKPTEAWRMYIPSIRDAITAYREASGEANRLKDRFDDYCMSWRGLDREADKVCVKCGGSGQRLYSNTSTWRNIAGGQAMTRDVCDRCWGSGDESRPWPSWKERNTEAELAALREALEAVDDWDLRWADGLDSNVERVKKIVRDALGR